MPAVYAHYRFGEHVYEALNDNLKSLIEPHKKAFQIGLQGPDLFFFYHPWKQNDLVEYGNILHEKPARYLFHRGLNNDRGSAAYAYMMGVACHFALDSMCHPFVSKFESKSGVPHIEIESEFEKMLLRRDDKNPFTYPTDLLIPADEDTARTIYGFYRIFDIEKIHYALRWMQTFRRLFTEPSAVRQKIMNGLLDIFGFGKFKGQILQLKDNSKCAKSNIHLYQLYKDAIPYAVSLLEELDYCKENETSLSEEWDKSFA